MVLPDVQPILGLDALVGDAWTDHFGQSENVDRMHVERTFDFVAHGVGPRFGAENASLQRGRTRIDALACELVEDRQHVARRNHDDVGLEILNQLHLPLCHAARNGYRQAAQPFDAVVRAEPTGEQAVSVGDVHLHARPPARCTDRTGHHVGPHRDVVGGVADDGRLACSAGRGVYTRELVLRHGEHAERVVRAQVGFRGQWKLGQITERLQVVRVDAHGIERLPVVGHVVVDAVQGPLETFEL